MLEITIDKNRAVLTGPITKRLEEDLQARFVWYDIDDLTNPIYFYAEGVMYLGLIYDVADVIEELGHQVKVNLPDLGEAPNKWNFIGKYRERQEEAVDALIEARFGVLKAAPGFGKTVCMAAVTAKVGRNTAIIVQAGEPFDQAYNTLRKLTDIPKIGRVSGESRDLYPVTVYMIQSLAKEIAENPDGEVATHFRNAEVVMVDECFPKGTIVSGKAIECWQVGDIVESYNHDTGQTEWRRVKRTFKSRPKSMVRVWFDDGSFQDCTSGHPFWVGDRYVAARELSNGFMVYNKCHENAMWAMQRAFRDYDKESKRSLSQGAGGVLHQSVRDAGYRCGVQGDSCQHKSEICFGKDEAEQSDAPRRQFGAHEGYVETYKASAARTWGKRVWVDNLRGTVTQLLGRLGRAPRSQDRHEARQQLPNQLQDRHRTPYTKDCGGGGWGVTFCQRATSARSQERGIFEGKRVDRVEIHQPTSDGRFGGVCPDGYVYNVEVEHNHNYFANGILVHNCHHAAADTYLSALNAVEDPMFVLGFSATPEEREDGLQPFVKAYLGTPVFEVTYGEQIAAGNLCPVSVYVVNVPPKDYGWSKDRSIPAWKKRQLYQKVYEDYIIYNRWRNVEAITFAQDMIHEGMSVAMIVSRVEHALEIKRLYPDVVVLTSDTRERKDILSKLRNKEIMCVVTTLFDEATDVPSLGAVCMLAGGKTEIRLRQRIRSTRTFSGETAQGHYEKTRGYVWYPVDQADFLKSHSTKCLKVLRSIVKEHPQNEIVWVQ